MLQDVLAKKLQGPRSARRSWPSGGPLSYGRPAGVCTGAPESHRVVLPAEGEGRRSVSAPHGGDRRYAGSVWILVDLHPAAPRGLAGQSQACLSALPNSSRSLSTAGHKTTASPWTTPGPVSRPITHSSNPSTAASARVPQHALVPVARRRPAEDRKPQAGLQSLPDALVTRRHHARRVRGPVRPQPLRPNFPVSADPTQGRTSL
jgi:hypothetical protein